MCLRWMPQQLVKGKLDGIIAIPSGDVFISSWEANVVYRGRPGEAVRNPPDPPRFRAAVR